VCLMCGTAVGSTEMWRDAGGTCAVCGNETYRDECARCRGVCAMSNGAEARRCVALDVYRASGRVAFPERAAEVGRRRADSRPDSKKPPKRKKSDGPEPGYPPAGTIIGTLISAAWQHYKRSLYRYADFEGRSSRAELLSFVAWQVCGFLLTGVVGWALLFFVATLLPTWAVAVRRLHDIGKSGQWLWVLVIWPLALVVLPCMLLWPGTKGPNPYGPPTG